MFEIGTLTGVAVVMISSLVLLLCLLFWSGQSRLDSRLQSLSGKGEAPAADPLMSLARSTLAKSGSAFLPRSEEDRTRLQSRLIHAGLYSRQALVLFLGVKMLLMAVPVLAGLAAGLFGWLGKLTPASAPRPDVRSNIMAPQGGFTPPDQEPCFYRSANDRRYGRMADVLDHRPSQGQTAGGA